MSSLLEAARAFVGLLHSADEKELDDAYQRLAYDANNSEFAEKLEPLSGVCVAFQAEWKRRAWRAKDDEPRDEFKVQLDFAFEDNLDAEVNGVCEKYGIDAWYLVELVGPGGGCPVVEFRGSHASLKKLCDARESDESEHIEQIDEETDAIPGIEKRRPWKVVPIKTATDGGAVMSMVYDDDDDGQRDDALVESSACAKVPYCVLQIGHSGKCSSEFIPSTDDVREMIASGEETGGGDLTDAQIAEALS